MNDQETKEQKVKCEDCGWEGVVSDLILKMSGSLCPDCRYVVLYPDDGHLTIPVILVGGSEPDSLA